MSFCIFSIQEYLNYAGISIRTWIKKCEGGIHLKKKRKMIETRRRYKRGIEGHLHVSDKSEITDRFSRRGRVGVGINSDLNRDITIDRINNFSNGSALAKDIRKLAYADTNYMTTINYTTWIRVRNIMWHEYSNAIVSMLEIQ